MPLWHASRGISAGFHTHCNAARCSLLTPAVCGCLRMCPCCVLLCTPAAACAARTLVETVVKNCGITVHREIAKEHFMQDMTVLARRHCTRTNRESLQVRPAPGSAKPASAATCTSAWAHSKVLLHTLCWCWCCCCCWAQKLALQLLCKLAAAASLPMQMLACPVVRGLPPRLPCLPLSAPMRPRDARWPTRR